MSGHELPIMATAFTRRQVTDLRHSVGDHARRLGLRGARHENFVLAVHEAVTNVVDHAGGRGLLRLWQADTQLHCEISDSGPGIPDGTLDSPMPPLDHFGGRGLWLVRLLSDATAIDTGPTGTRVRITVRLTPLPEPA